MKSSIKNITIGFLVILLTAANVGCALQSSTRAGSVGADRKQFLTVSASEMDKAAVTAYDKILAQSKQKGTLNRDPQQVQRIRTIAKRLQPHTKIYRDDAPSWDWRVNLIESKQLNAWCMPGGKIAFYSGIINTLQLTDGEIAAIMGHEIAHALREHGRERASEGQVTSIGLGLLGAFAGLSGSSLQLAQQVTAITLTLPNSRKHEIEADRMGVELAARAGYDPFDAVKVWEKMASVSSGSPPEILSTHPSNKTRIRDLKKHAASVNPLYLKARKI